MEQMEVVQAEQIPARLAVLAGAGAALGLLGSVLALAGFPAWALLGLAGAALTAGGLAALIAAFRRREASLRRTVRKLETQLAQSEAETEKARAEGLEQLGHFQSALSHGLRLPIAIIKGYADLLRGGLVADESAQQEYLVKLTDRVDYISSLFDQMLTESRLNAGMQVLSREPFDLLGLVHQVVEDVTPVANRQEVRIAVVCDQERVIFPGDSTQLTKVFYNLLENSLKHMGTAGRIDITVSCPDQKQVLLVFRDSGEGMDEGETQRIFERGYQGSNHRGGSGMGLYLSRLLVEAHGGSISAKSSPGRGMSMYVLLPLEGEAKG